MDPTDGLLATDATSQETYAHEIATETLAKKDPHQEAVGTDVELSLC